jgi:hypothetical protein
LFSEICNSCPSSKYENSVSYQYKSAGKIVVVYIAILSVLESMEN